MNLYVTSPGIDEHVQRLLPVGKRLRDPGVQESSINSGGREYVDRGSGAMQRTDISVPVLLLGIASAHAAGADVSPMAGVFTTVEGWLTGDIAEFIGIWAIVGLGAIKEPLTVYLSDPPYELCKREAAKLGVSMSNHIVQQLSSTPTPDRRIAELAVHRAGPAGRGC